MEQAAQSPGLGQLSRIDPRDFWKDEEKDFTPWLKKNIDLLSEAIGIDVEIEDTEVPIGDFSCDILGREVGRERPVVIENQLTPTDHDHLGKLLTYAAGVEAMTIVWISTEFRDEHRSALEWLNEHSQEGVGFFGVEVELLRIDDSKPAPNFLVVASPSQWQKTAADTGVTPKQRAYREFFTELLSRIKAKYPGLTHAKAAEYGNWFPLPAGVGGFSLVVSFARNSKMRADLYIDMEDKDYNKRIFDILIAEKEEIEHSFGEALSWERLDNKRACRIATYRDGTVEKTDLHEELMNWAIDRVGRFRKVFDQNRLKKVAEDAETTTA